MRMIGPRMVLIAFATLGATWALGMLFARPVIPGEDDPPTAVARQTSQPTNVLAPEAAMQQPATALQAIIAEVVVITNQARLENGCPAMLTSNPLLEIAAQRHSEDMALRGYVDHVSPDGVNPTTRLAEVGYSWSRYGENIAAGHDSPASVVEGWMNSPGHRANILNCDFREIGVGYAEATEGGGASGLWTQVLAVP